MADFTKQKTFTVTMDYLREVVAKHTFRDSPAAALRELIQNAHDACLIRSAHDGHQDLSVHITLDPVDKKITIEDTGIGMTLTDIHEYLTTVGKGTKGTRLAEKYGIDPKRSKRLENVVGEFGFGFIAAFIIADSIVLTTRFADEGSPTVRCFFSSETNTYEAKETDEIGSVGTKLELELNRKTLAQGLKPSDDPTQGNILSFDTVDAIVKKYCILLEFPIYVTFRGEPAQSPSNAVELPWKAESRIKEAVQRFYDNRIGKNKLGEILHIVPVSLSHDRGDRVTMEGVLFIEDAPPGDEEAGNLEVFVKRMWVCEREQSLLSAWASFMRGMIVTPDLRPLPGRDSLDKEHDGFDRVRAALHELLTNAFVELARSNSKIFNKMQDRYGVVFRWGLVKEKSKANEQHCEFREAQLLRYVKFLRYSRKHMTGQLANLNEFLDVRPDQPLEFKDRKRIVNFIARPVPRDRQLEFRRLLASGSLEVIVPYDESELFVLTTINEVFDDVILKNIENELVKTYAGILEGDRRQPWLPVVKYFQGLASQHNMAGADVGDLEPEYMPALILNVPISQEVSSGTDGDHLKEQPKLPLIPGLPPEVASYYQQTLIVNARNSTMKQLLEYRQSAALEEADDVLAVCLHETYHLALQATIDALPADMLRHHVEVSCKTIEEYVKASKARLGEAARAQQIREELETAVQQTRRELETLSQERDSYRVRYGELEVGEPEITVPSRPEKRLGVIVFCDLIGSTGSVVGMDFDERGFVLNEFVKLAKQEVATHGGFFDKFTGDGLMALFGLQCLRKADGSVATDEQQDACKRAWAFGQEITAAMTGFNNRPDIGAVIDNNHHIVGRFELRTAMTAGYVHFGAFGGRGTAVGVPVIVAARLCAEKEAFRQTQSHILVDNEFVRRSGIMDAFQQVSYKFEARGIPGEFKIYCHKAP